MPTLAEKLSASTPVSLLLRKAGRLGLHGVDDFIRLAGAKGCRHYTLPGAGVLNDPGVDALSDEELSILLLVGENEYEPMAIRCAAQMMRSPRVRPKSLVRLAVMEKAERVLAHIARAGLAHDLDGHEFWRDVLELLEDVPQRNEPNLPHWTRFVSMPGYQRHEKTEPRWLTPSR